MKRRFLCVLLAIALLMTVFLINVLAYNEGKYEATSAGHNGDLVVSVSFSNDRIEAIEVVNHKETIGIGDLAIKQIPEAIIKSQTLLVDAVAGASATSKAIVTAVADCVKQAGGNIDILEKDVEAPEVVKENNSKEDTVTEVYTDVLVIGGGGAGLTAAIEAKRAGANVVVLERLDFLGGDTILAGGGIEAAGTRFQEMHGIYGDTPEAQRDFINSRGLTYRNPDLLRVMTENAADAVEFLVELGSDMTGKPRAGHGSPVGRAHCPPSGSAGQNIMKPVIQEIEKLGIQVFLGAPGLELLEDNGEIKGAKGVRQVDGKPFTVFAKSVVIATGNFASNNEMVAQYDQRLKGIDTNSSAGSLGDGIKMAAAVGADLENMNIFRVTTGFPRGGNFIAISQDGERFMNEKHTHDTIFRKGDDLHILINANREEKHYYVILDNDEFQAHEAVYSPYIEKGVGFSAETLSDLSKKLGVNETALSESIEKWNKSVSSGNDFFGRDLKEARAIQHMPFYGIIVKPRAHTCAGGIRIDVSAAVLDTQQQRIPGLFAAGEVTGGVHDGVSAVEGAIVYGRIAGKSAADYALNIK